MIDFFVVSPHGGGLQSFLYYLAKIGLHTSGWAETAYYGDCEAAFQAIVSARQHHRFVGMTIDKPLPDIRKYLPAMALESVPVFWLVRDPISLLKSCINQQIGDAIVRRHDPRNPPPYPLAWTEFRYTLKSMLLYFPTTYLLYPAQLSSVGASQVIRVIDTTMLMGKTAQTTMEMVAGHFPGIRVDVAPEIFQTAFNNFQNRLHILFNPYFPVMISGQKVFPVHFLPKRLYDFHYGRTRSLILKTVNVDGEDFVLVSSSLARIHLPGMATLLQALGSSELILREKAIQDHIRRRREAVVLMEREFNEQKCSEEQVIEGIMEVPCLKDRFLSLAEEAIAAVDSIQPGHSDRWEFTMRCFKN